MKLTRLATIALCLLQFRFFAQDLKNFSRISASNPSDTVLWHLEMKDADYDPNKNHVPYYIVSNPTGYNEKATPNLIVKNTRLVEEKHAAVIRKYFSRFISGQFALQQNISLRRNQNLNQYRLIPFRMNAQNQLEELTDYDVSWQFSSGGNLGARGASTFTSTSILSSGSWYKIAVTQTGIHRLTRSFFSSIGINPSTLDPSKIRIYGNGGKMLPERNKDLRSDDLEENAIKVVTNQDGTLDYVLFYATGTTDWQATNAISGLRFRPVKSLYSDTSFYFINVDLGPGKRIASRASLSQTPDFTSASYDYYNYHEEDIVNFGKSGRSFYGEYFDITTSYSFNWDVEDLLPDTLVSEVTVAATNNDSTIFIVTGNGLNFRLRTDGIPPGGSYSDHATLSTRQGKAINSNGSGITLSVSKLTAKSFGWLDRIVINARRSLNLKNRQFCFRDSRTTGAGKTCGFSISNVSGASNIQIWNVSDPLEPEEQSVTANGQSLGFVCNTDLLNEYCVAPPSDFYTPVYVGKVTNQNLHGLSKANYIIITHPLFRKEAEYLGAFHQKKEGLSYVVASIDQIYNEFSSGKQDISAIRDFIRMLYERTISLPDDQQLKYVLLMGDGSFNNKNRNTTNNSNFIPTYESRESLSPTGSIVTDDFYGLMDPEEGYFAEDDSNQRVDLGVGRFPCRTVSEVKSVIAKIENYYRKDANYVANNSRPESSLALNESPLGDWRTWLLFLGDDEDSATHMAQSDRLVKTVKTISPMFNIDEINLDAYQRFSTPGGNRYPDAAADFLKRINKGTLVFNYTGHGGEVGLTAERMIDLNIINGLDNFNKLPLFITATCEFSRYDDPGRTSAGELCLLNPKGGAIALLTTCRVAYSTFNEQINSEILKSLFNRLPNGKWPTLGDAIAAAKAAKGQSSVFANFHLLGDPALVLSYPEEKVVTSHFNDIAVSPSVSDTLSALSKVTVKGFVADNAGNKLSSFNGLVYPTVFDKEQLVSGLLNTPESGIMIGGGDTAKIVPYTFKLQKNILYRGKSLVTNGEFSFTFLVPKDISFAIGPGKISYYATDGTIDAAGYYSQLLVGGASGDKSTLSDNEGPQVNLFLNDKSFVSGGLTNEKPVLFADLVDSSGINTLGTGIGHDISVIMDANSSKPVVLNDYYEANLNSYQSGRVRYPYGELTEGEHNLTFKVWDIQNNSTTVYTDFIVAKSADLALRYVLNYPNPFSNRTKFMFQHNQACNPMKVTVQIYTVSGKIVKTIQKSAGCEGSAPEGIEWDGRDEYGDKLARGVYIYKLAILDAENKKAEKIEKLVILN